MGYLALSCQPRLDCVRTCPSLQLQHQGAVPQDRRRAAGHGGPQHRQAGGPAAADWLAVCMCCAMLWEGSRCGFRLPLRSLFQRSAIHRLIQSAYVILSFRRTWWTSTWRPRRRQRRQAARQAPRAPAEIASVPCTRVFRVCCAVLFCCLPFQRPVLGPCNTSHLQARLNVQGRAPAPAGGSIAPAGRCEGARLTLNWRSVAVVPLVGREVSRSRRTSHACHAQDCHPAPPAFPAIPPPARDCVSPAAALSVPPAHPPHLPCTPMALGLARAPRATQASVEGSAAALGAAIELLGGRGRRRQTLLRRRRAAVLPAASFDLGSFNFNPTDWLKVPRDQTGITLYPWMAHSMREMAMRRWLQKEVRWVGRGRSGGSGIGSLTGLLARPDVTLVCSGAVLLDRPA